MEIKRKKFQGVLNILSFNRHFYVIGLTILALITCSKLVIDWSDLWFWTIVIAFVYGLLMPLVISAYVYDFSGYYNFEWLNSYRWFDDKKTLLVNINAGFDETSFLVKQKFPQSDLKVFDFYDSERHTEPAIIRARKVTLTYPKTSKILSGKIPLENDCVDILFLLSAAHEIRSNDEKIDFLKECRRIIKPSGYIIMVEHLRDLPNFLAFSVGFTHFFSRKTWKKAFNKAEFSTFKETKFTPFMSIFECKP
ncbi:methyltransferase domain-containing protein [Sediminibacter sp. Hel_I_10]|uniref:methyltransferase domain-containing protein n=1 Tax=Sediminibacter sp. Hel_I_10 TaxID=1392490 RepID=UPI00047D8FB6|nr:methyltransferase domain-containing protein [Sediminibacter sp. Hel_I_10]